MAKTPFGSGGWDPRPYDEQVRAQKPRIIPSDVSTVHDVPLPKNQSADPEELPYPVLRVNATSRVHLVPVYTACTSFSLIPRRVGSNQKYVLIPTFG